MAADPKNPLPLKNLGAIFGHEGGSLRAPSYLRQSNECNPQGLQTVYGLAFARDSIGPAQKHFPAVLEMEAPEELRRLARNELHEIAARELKAKGPGKDGGLLSGWARRLFLGKSQEETREIAFEIGMLGKYGAGHQRPPGEPRPVGCSPGRAF